MARQHNPAAWSARQQAILEAAEKRFAQHGLYATKIADIARDCGVADGTIYLYFDGGKEGLFDALLQRRKLMELDPRMRGTSVLDDSVKAYGVRLTVGAEQFDRIARVVSAT